MNTRLLMKILREWSVILVIALVQVPSSFVQLTYFESNVVRVLSLAFIIYKMSNFKGKELAFWLTTIFAFITSIVAQYLGYNVFCTWVIPDQHLIFGRGILFPFEEPMYWYVLGLFATSLLLYFRRYE